MAFSVGGAGGSSPIQGSGGEGEKKPDPKGVLKTPGGKYDVSLTSNKEKTAKVPEGIVKKNREIFEQKIRDTQTSSRNLGEFKLVTAKQVMIDSDDEDIDTEGDPAVKAEGDQTVKVEGDPAVKAEGDETVKVEGDPAVKAEGDQTVKIEGDPAVKAEGDETVKVEGDPAVKAQGEQSVQAERTVKQPLMERVCSGFKDVKANIEEGSVAIIQDSKASKADKNKCMQAIRDLLSRIRSLLIRVRDSIVRLFSKKGEDFVATTQKNVSYVEQWVNSLPESWEDDIPAITQSNEGAVSGIEARETSEDWLDMVAALEGIEEDLQSIG